MPSSSCATVGWSSPAASGWDVLGAGVSRITPATPVERQFPTATELADGTVLVTGGYNEQTRVTASALLVRP